MWEKSGKKEEVFQKLKILVPRSIVSLKKVEIGNNKAQQVSEIFIVTNLISFNEEIRYGKKGCVLSKKKTPSKTQKSRRDKSNLTPSQEFNNKNWPYLIIFSSQIPNHPITWSTSKDFSATVTMDLILFE